MLAGIASAAVAAATAAGWVEFARRDWTLVLSVAAVGIGLQDKLIDGRFWIVLMSTFSLCGAIAGATLACHIVNFSYEWHRFDTEFACSLVPWANADSQYWLQLGGGGLLFSALLAVAGATVWKIKPLVVAYSARRGEDRARARAARVAGRREGQAAVAEEERPRAALGVSADPSTSSRALVLRVGDARAHHVDKKPPSQLKAPKHEVLDSGMATERGKVAVLVTWPEASDGHRTRPTEYLCTKLSGRAEQAVYSGRTSGCEVLCEPGERVQFVVQAKNGKGLGPRSTPSRPLQVPPCRTPHARAGSSADPPPAAAPAAPAPAVGSPATPVLCVAAAQRVEAKGRLRAAVKASKARAVRRDSSTTRPRHVHDTPTTCPRHVHDTPTTRPRHVL